MLDRVRCDRRATRALNGINITILHIRSVSVVLVQKQSLVPAPDARPQSAVKPRRTEGYMFKRGMSSTLPVLASLYTDV